MESGHRVKRLGAIPNGWMINLRLRSETSAMGSDPLNLMIPTGTSLPNRGIFYNLRDIPQSALVIRQRFLPKKVISTIGLPVADVSLRQLAPRNHFQKPASFVRLK